MATPLPSYIKHVVVVMLENRSFDNVFGGLYPASENFHGLTGKEYNVVMTSPSPTTFTVWQAASPQAPWYEPVTTIPNPDPGEYFEDMNVQLFGTKSPNTCASPTMGGFAANYQGQSPTLDNPPHWPNVRDIMQYYRADKLPTSFALAKTHAVSDVWFAAAPVQTLCNRTFVHTGTASKNPAIPNTSRVNNEDYTQGLTWEKIITGNFEPPVTDTTVFEMLDIGAGGNSPLNWKVYYHDAPLSALCDYVYKYWYDISGGNVYGYYSDNPFQGITNFEWDIKHGTLATYSFIEPAYITNPLPGGRYCNSNHPGGSQPTISGGMNGEYGPPPGDMAYGEVLLADIYNTLMKYPAVAESTLLIVTYDEHGGLYDHIAPGQAVSPFSPKVSNFNYDRYGVRVPAILIHPRMKSGAVFRPSDGQPATGTCGSFTTGLDHTSIIATLCAQFTLGTPPTPRAATAATLAGLPLPPSLEGAERHVSTEVMAAGAAAAAAQLNVSRQLGTELRVRNGYQQLKEQSNTFEGSRLGVSVLAMSGLAFFKKLRRAVHPVGVIFDLDQKSTAALDAIGVRDTRELRVAIMADGGVDRIAKHVGVDPKLVIRWGQQANLLRVPGVSEDDAHVLVEAGFNGVSELAKANADSLCHKLASVLKQLGVDEVIPKAEIDRWIQEAQQIGDP